MERKNSSREQNECESRLSDSPEQQETREESVIAKESLADWGVVACVFLSNFISAIDFSGFGVFYPYLVEHFEATTAAVGWCYSINGFFQAVVALFAIYPIKFYGCRLPGVVGCLIFCLGCSLSYLAPNLTTIYFTYGVIAGSGSGLAMLSTNIIVPQRFNRNRNLASGISLLGFSCGGIVASIVVNQLIQLYSWRGAFLIIAAIYAQRIALCLFFRTPKRLISQTNNAPEIRQQRLKIQVILKYLKETFDFSILRDARFSVYSTAYFLHMFCLYGYLPHTVNRAIQVGLTSDQAVNAATMIGIMATVTRVPVSFIANHRKVNSSLVFATGMFFVFLSIVAVFINPGIAGTMTSTVLFGTHLGCTTTVFSVVAVDLMGLALLPRSLAILQVLEGVAGLVSPSLIGWVFDVTGDYNKAYGIIGCMAFASCSLMVVLTFAIRCHRKFNAKSIELPPLDSASPGPPTYTDEM